MGEWKNADVLKNTADEVRDKRYEEWEKEMEKRLYPIFELMEGAANRGDYILRYPWTYVDITSHSDVEKFFKNKGYSVSWCKFSETEYIQIEWGKEY